MAVPTVGSQLFVKAANVAWEDLGDGIERQILGYDGALMLVRVRFAPGAVGSLHHHPHRQVTLVESGRFEVEIAGERQVLVAGDSFFIPPDVEHGVVALEAGGLADIFAPAREEFVKQGAQ